MLTPPRANSPAESDPGPRDRYDEDLEYLGAPCGYCREHNCPGAGGGDCPESPYHPDNSPNWCTCTSELMKCPWNVALRANDAPPSPEVLRAFHRQLRRQNARDGLRTSLACLRRWPNRPHHWRQVPREAADLIRAYWDTKGGVR